MVTRSVCGGFGSRKENSASNASNAFHFSYFSLLQIYIYIKAVQTVSGYGGYGTRFSGFFQTSHVESFHYWSIGLSVFLYVSRLPSCVFLIHPGTKEVVCTLHFYSRVLFRLADP
jgi:hypothetical protein